MEEDELTKILVRIENRLTKIEVELDNTVIRLNTKHIATILIIIISLLTGIKVV